MTQPETGTTSAETKTDWARTMLETACAEVGLSARGAKLVKFTNNAVYILADAPITVRIAGSAAVRERVPTIIDVARWLASHDIPAVRLVERLPQPLPIHDSVVTFWHTVTTPAGSTPEPDGYDLGRLLRRYHALPGNEIELPTWNPLISIRHRIAEQTVLTTADHRFLDDTCADLEHELSTLTFELQPGPIHGDSFIGNLITAPEGPVLCDFDSASYGPREWDLTPIAVGKLRFDYPTDYHNQLAHEYGLDVTGLPCFHTLRRLRELQLVTSVLPVLETNRSLFEQWQHRFLSFKNGDANAKWTTYR